MSSDRTTKSDDGGRVIPFRPRGVSRSGWRWPLRPAQREQGPVDDLAKFERAETKDDYRHRMTMNVLGLAATIVLVIIGIWLANTIAQMRRDQDCYLSGRRDCTPINAPPMQRG